MNPLADYPFESRFLTVDGHRMHYVDEGPRDGEVLLLLHGNPTWSYLYRHQINDLKADYRCIAPDHLGFGLSDKPKKADYSMRAQIMRLDHFIAKLGLNHITLIVQDWGGIIGLSWGARHKRLVKRLVIMNTAGFVFDKARPKPPIPRGMLQLFLLKLPGIGELFVQGLNGFVRYLLPRGIVNRERLSPAALAGYSAPYPDWPARRAQLASVRQIPIFRSHPTWQLLYETGEELVGWNVPVQLIWGMQDTVFTADFLNEFERRLPHHAPSVRIPDAGHYLQDDRPECVTQALRQFLRNESTEQKEATREKHTAVHAVHAP